MSDDPASKAGLRWEIRQILAERLLIPWEGMGEMANQQRAEAAVQIVTMMEEIKRLRAERDEARRERDDARRWICRDCETPSVSAQEIADSNNWDCFKENA